MLRLPLPATDDLRLADWLELYALISQDSNASYIDLERALRREGVFGPDDSDDIEHKIQEVSSELERRALSAHRAYPFGFTERSIFLRDAVDNFAPYVFCLCLSFFSTYEELNNSPYPRRMFEYLCCAAARNFVSGDVVRFGSPRQPPELPVRFDEAVNELCVRMEEGNGFTAARMASRKDDGLDLVAWRTFPDHAEGKLLLIGHCASGKDWKGKLDELRPDVFFPEWTAGMPISVLFGMKAFFVPHRLDPSDWRRISRRAGIIFDRCRIAYWVSETDDFRDKQQYLRWARRVLDREAE